jgi:hypothetical protein
MGMGYALNSRFTTAALSFDHDHRVLLTGFGTPFARRNRARATFGSSFNCFAICVIVTASGMPRRYRNDGRKSGVKSASNGAALKLPSARTSARRLPLRADPKTS